MQTQNTIATKEIDRVGTISLLREVDFVKLAEEAEDGKLTVEQLQNSGDFVVEIKPSGRDAKTVRVPQESEAAGRAFMSGFECAVSLKKKSPRKDKKPVDPEARKAAAAAAKKKKAAAAAAGKK
jgi:hypothetical protein